MALIASRTFKHLGLMALAALGCACAQCTLARPAPSSARQAAPAHTFHFLNILPFSPGAEKQAAQDMIEYQRRTGNDVVLYSLTLHPEGRPAMRKVNEAVVSYRKLKAELKGSKVRLGVLLQAILGHWPRVDKDEEPWTRSVNIDGENVRYCPLDPHFQDYITKTVTLLAQEGPVFILSDDDVRSFSPRPECFCKLHTDLFNSRFGTRFTPEEYRAAVANSQVGDDIYRHYDIIRREMVNSVVKLIRKAIDSVDPSIPSGTCMPGWEYRFNGETARHMAGPRHPPVMRICNANYFEGSAKDFPHIVAHTQSLRQAHLDIPFVLDEADTCPHNLYSRSAYGMHAKLCSSIMAGLRGAKIWYVNSHKRGYPVNRAYTDILAENRGLYQTLTEEVGKTVPTGTIIPGHNTFDKWHPNGVFQQFIEPEHWGKVLGRYGLPFQVSYDHAKPGTYAITGAEDARRFTDAELRNMFANRLLLDGPATAVLYQRGYGKLMGVKAELNDFRYNREKYAHSDQTLPCSQSAQSPQLTLLDPDRSEVITQLFYSAFEGSSKQEDIVPGTVVYRNDLGGTVCTTSMNLYNPFDLWGELRKAWLTRCLDRLAGGMIPFSIENTQDMTLLTRQYPQGASLLAVFNLNADPARSLVIRCAQPPTSVEILKGDGAWSHPPYTLAGNQLTIHQVLHHYHCLILRLR